MKNLLTVLFILVSFSAFAQTNDTLVFTETHQIIDSVTCEKTIRITKTYEIKIKTCTVPVKHENECVYNSTKWKNLYKNCKDAPKGRYCIQFLYTINCDIINTDLPHVILQDKCGCKYRSLMYRNYCDALSDLPKYLKQFPDSFITLIKE